MDEVATFASSAVYNIGLQFTFRLISFALNGCLLRIISKDLLGVANVRLMLLYSTLSFLIREPFRRAGIQRLETENGDTHGISSQRRSRRQWSQFINVLWLCPLLSIPSALTLCFVWIRLLKAPDENKVFWYNESVIFYALSVVIETAAEPLWVVGQQLRFVRLKAVIEGIQIMVRVVLIASILVLDPHSNLRAFSFAMIISSTLYVVLYYGYFWNYVSIKIDKTQYRSFGDLFPKISCGLDRDIWNLAKSFWTHSLLKQLLTEGEKYIMTFFNVLDFGDQGIYDVIHNLGSLVARFLFAPLEESAYSYFSLILYRDKPARQQDPLTALVGLTVCAFGSAYSYLALHLYGGNMLSSGIGPSLLRWYCVYVLLLALNGITECFAFAAMKKEDVKRHQSFLLVFCVGFLLAALILTNRSVFTGLVLGKMTSFLNLHPSAADLHFIERFYRDIQSVEPARQLIPKIEILIALVVDVIFTTLSNVIFCCDGVFNTCAHIAVGALCLFATIMTVHSTDRDIVEFVEVFVLKKKVKQK